MAEPALRLFTEPTRTWFEGAFSAPTAAQEGAWRAVAAGHHALVVAPTGSGKTLAAFLWALDRFVADAPAGGSAPDPAAETPPAGTGSLRQRARAAAEGPRPGTRVLYVSPLKALGVDVERNLRAPLIGIAQTARHQGRPAPEVSVGVRSGDTPQAVRRALLSSPPDILITTPESLYLMLTSKARETLTGVETVIVDEVHAVAGTKRGAHLAVTLERLDALLERPAQRIGLSATVEPIETVARFLGGREPVAVVAPEAEKRWDLTVSVPIPDMTVLGGPAASPSLAGSAFGDDDLDSLGPQASASIWPHVEERVVDLVLANRATIVFANSRSLAEKLTARLNEIHAFRLEHAAGGTAADPGADAGPGAEAADPGTRSSGGAPRPVGEVLRETLADGAGGPRGGPAPGTAPAGPAAGPARQHGRYEGADPVLARAHHGSVSKDQRALIEDDLKTGRLRCVVATSSLELGIDMGAVDLVVQIEAPPSAASGLQRVGRAGHQVGEVSRGWLYPKHRGDLLDAAVTVERMLQGRIEPLAIPANPLDVLAQHTVAASALGPLDVEEWLDVVRRSAPFLSLPRSAFDAVLDLLSGRYPSDEFAELRPRIVWDRETGTIEGRPGAQRLAVTSGGTIPDRGLFAVYLVGEQDGKNSRRVGELDEEMVYESRVGDVIALGASSWRIEEITHDRVIVSPAPGVPGKLPFWHGDGPGRPVELGRAVGRFVREVAGAAPEQARARLSAAGLDEWAADNLLAYLAEQQEAVGQMPSDRLFVVERFHDELGDWRVVLHSPFGMPVHAPWALAVGARLQERYGLDGAAQAADDGIVLRVPAMEDEPPGAELFLFDPDELELLVTEQVGGSALFASRFRECAARALLLPRRDPGRRTPLWQQRQRSAQLLDVARKYPQFPIILETVRECLQDVYDLPALQELHRAVERRAIRVVETTTEQPSPFARTLLFGYVSQFLYEGDSPLAERKAAVLSLDTALLNELLGRAELRELLDPEVIERTGAELQRLAPDRRLRGAEGAADLLRLLGPLSAAEAARRLQDPEDPERACPEEIARAWLEQLVAANRALRVQLRGVESWAAIEDAARLRDALGVPLPMGVPLAFVEPVEDPLADLVARYARTHGPFTAEEAAGALGLGVAVVRTTLERLGAERRVVEGEFRPAELLAGRGLRAGAEWCEAEVLRRIRRRSLAALRREVEPVAGRVYARFLPAWQHVGRGNQLRGEDGVLTVVDQLAGTAVPASAWEPLVLAARVADYRPELLDELTASGEVLWAGAGSLAGDDGWVSLHLSEAAALTLPPAEVLAERAAFLGSALERRVLEALGTGGAWFFPQLLARLDATGEPVPAGELTTALWNLVWAGLVTNDTFLPVRSLLAGGRAAHRHGPRTPRGRSTVRRGAARLRSGTGPRPGGPAAGRAGAGVLERHDAPLVAGRWSRLDPEPLEPTLRASATAELLLDRYGVVTRGPVAVEEVPGGFATMYKVLSTLEDTGRARRGYFVEGLGAAQFAQPATVDHLRGFSTDDQVRPEEPVVLALAATDPANPYGAALEWPQPVAAPAPDGGAAAPGRHRPGRKAGAVVVLVDGTLVLYVERGGRTVLVFDDDAAAVAAAGPAVAETVRRGAVDKLTVEKVNGAEVLGPGPLETAVREALLAGGFYSTPRGLRMRR
ncbi:DEAD/DEAH box helicase [Kocuria flava]|uniref:DEAD/DEAH box helicase n=1 Tax=Kocuria flava TaxID=446860 RepID=A0A0U3G5Q8_9MICC|nr:DEAD/DEAH box helicase [Kocuria flava]ALU38475.1 DEAD/DEAH box helicase [Kocuria flava]GEO93005.1 DEAD/DEAH box helicase [Kocuria flava]